jgi:hypothetical protein
LRPEPSCPALPGYGRQAFGDPESVLIDDDFSRPFALSADVWEAVHKATGLPVVADCYTHLYPVDKVTVERRPLFEALCTVSDALGARWTKDGDFLLCRSTSYFWDKLKDIPNRYLQHWARDRDSNGGLPVSDLLDMAGESDEQLDSTVVAQGIERYWKLPEWAILNYPYWRHLARFMATLEPDKLRRVLQPDGLPLPELSPAEQQAAMQLQFDALSEMESEGGTPTPIPPDWWSHALVHARYVPAGWYAWMPTAAFTGIWRGPAPPIAGRTAQEALAAVRPLYPAASLEDVKQSRRGYFNGGISFFFRGK